MNILIHCPNGIAFESERGILNHRTWTVGVTGKLGRRLSLLLSSVAGGTRFLCVADSRAATQEGQRRRVRVEMRVVETDAIPVVWEEGLGMEGAPDSQCRAGNTDEVAIWQFQVIRMKRCRVQIRKVNLEQLKGSTSLPSR